MIEGIESIYQNLADAITSSVPVAWSSARSEATFFSDNIEFSGEYVPVSGSPRSFKVSREIMKAFDELRRKFKEAGQPLWGQVTFELTAEGKFNLKWVYDNCDANGDTIWDEQEWHCRKEERRIRLSQP